jgi:hypothetical protein
LSTIYFVYLSTFGEVSMVWKVILPSGRSRVMIRYRQAAEPPTAAEPSSATDKRTPPWHGQRVKLEDLPDFKARWGLVTVYAEWPEGARCPRLYLVEVHQWKPVGWPPGSVRPG